MASATETAIAALVAKLAALAAIEDAVIPAPMRNEVLPTRIPEFGAICAWLNVLDGEGGPEEGQTALGGGDVVPNDDAYSLIHRPVIEWIVLAADAAAREAAFDAALIAIHDALQADRKLGGAVSFVDFASLQRSNLNTDGLAGAKAVLVTLEMTLTSARPF